MLNGYCSECGEHSNELVRVIDEHETRDIESPKFCPKCFKKHKLGRMRK